MKLLPDGRFAEISPQTVKLCAGVTTDSMFSDSNEATVKASNKKKAKA